MPIHPRFIQFIESDQKNSEAVQPGKSLFIKKTPHTKTISQRYLMYGILESDRLSQRNLEDIFKDAHFKRLFNLCPGEKIARSFIPERLGKIPTDYSRQAYEHACQLFSQRYSLSEGEHYHIILMDSSMVADIPENLLEGMTLNGSKKVVK